MLKFNPIKQHQLARRANQLRQDVISMLAQAGSGHAAGSLGMADIFAVLYWHILKTFPQRPNDHKRDRLVLSNGHICPILYATLARAGFFPVEELSTLRQLGSRLQGHPKAGELPGVEHSGGPLGQGLSLAVGMALAGRLQQSKHRVYCLASDGELDEGQSWEAIMLAAKEKLDNLTLIIDRNNIQISGKTDQVLPLEPLADKFLAMNWHVQEIDGHNLVRFAAACDHAAGHRHQPSVIIARTIPGKGVSFMENDYTWHGQAPTSAQAKQALAELHAAAKLL